MLAARDQENLVHGHHQAAATKPLNQTTRAALPKTPGNRYPKTPLKLSIQDENGLAGFGGGGGKSVLGTKLKGNENLITGGMKGATFDKSAFITPMGPRNRAPLGIKTTNAKAKISQTPAGSVSNNDIDRTLNKATSARRPKPKISHAETVKLDIHGDETPLKEREVEYCPPKPKELPYESEDFPEGCLDLDMLKGPNLMRGWQNYYLNPVDENGIPLKDKQFEAELNRALRKTDERVRKAVEDEEWTIGDVPETFAHRRKMEKEHPKMAMIEESMKNPASSNKGPATVSSRKAASALSSIHKAAPVVTKSTRNAPLSNPSMFVRSKKPVAPPPANPSEMRHNAAAAASRSTIGYKKGRCASNVLQMGSTRSRGLPRSISNISTGSDTTITPETFTQKHEEESHRRRRLEFLGTFDIDDDDLEPGLRGELPDCLRKDDDDEEFVMSLGAA